MLLRRSDRSGFDRATCAATRHGFRHSFVALGLTVARGAGHPSAGSSGLSLGDGSYSGHGPLLPIVVWAARCHGFGIKSRTSALVQPNGRRLVGHSRPCLLYSFCASTLMFSFDLLSDDICKIGFSFVSPFPPMLPDFTELITRDVLVCISQQLAVTIGKGGGLG